MTVNALQSEVTGWLAKRYYNINNLSVYRYKTPKDAEAWCSGQVVDSTVQSLLSHTVQSSVSHTIQSEGVQTTAVDFTLVQYMYNQLSPHCQLAALSELFLTYTKQLSLMIFYKCSGMAIRCWMDKCFVQLS